MRAYQFIVALIVLATNFGWSQAAVDLARLTGTSNTIYHGTDLEQVDMTNGNLHVSIPLLHLPGRGIDTDIVLSYNSKIWQTLFTPSGEPNGSPFFGVLMDQDTNSLGFTTGAPASPGWSLGVPRMGSTRADNTECTLTDQNGNCENEIFHATFLTSEGNRISLVNYPSSNGSRPPQAVMGSIDGSFALLSGNSLVYKDGTIASFTTGTTRTQSLTDTNGNVIQCSFSGSSSLTGCVDTVGRDIGFTNNGPAGLPDTMTYLDSSGASQKITFQYQTFNLNYPFRDSGKSFCIDSGTKSLGQIPMLTSLTLANGLRYAFQYFINSDGSTTGEISKITLPGGGYIRFVHGFGPVDSDPQFLVCNLFQAIAQNRMVVNRFVSPDGTSASEQRWKYNATLTQGINPLIMTVTDPLGNSQVYTSNLGTPLPSQIDYKDVSGTVLKSVRGVIQCNVGIDPYFYGPGPCRYQSLTTVLPDTNQQSQITFSYTAFNDISTKDETDWGQGAPGQLLRETRATFLDQTDSRYLSAHMFGLPVSIGICSPLTSSESSAGVTGGDCPGNSSLKKRAETDNTYDESSFLTPYPGALPAGTHVAAPNPVRGNLSTTSRWVNSTNSSIVTHINWYDTGKPFQEIDALENATTHTYDPGAGAYPTQSCDPLSHCLNAAYDVNTGLETSFTDENGQITKYFYDLMFRISQVNWPAQVVNGSAIIGQTTFTYTDTPGSISVQRMQQQDGNTAITDFQYFDGLGRLVGTQLNDPSGNILVNTTFDAAGRVSTVTNPYRSTNDTTYGVTGTKYDGLGRVIEIDRPDGSTAITTFVGNARQVQDEGNGTSRVTRIFQRDALDRLVSVCEVTSASSASGDQPSNCNLQIAGTGFSTAYQFDALDNVTAVQQGAAPRSFNYDSVSHLLSANNPESGITSYTYDNNGNVLTRTRPAPNQGSRKTTVTSTYQYDKINRLTGITYSDGSTPSINIHYDTSLELGIGLDNTSGRMSAQYVTSPSGQVLSARVFSYDPLGRVIDNSQCVPQTCGSSTALPITYTYNLIGKPLSATNGEGVTFSYSYDGVGRLASISSTLSNTNHPAILFANATYNPLGALTTASVGNVLSEAFAYDCRSRVVSYGSALLPGTATAPTVTNPGCPISIANKPHGNPILGGLPGFFIAPDGLRIWPMPIPVAPLRSAVASRSTELAISHRILLARGRSKGKREHGLVTITVQSEGPGGATKAVSVPYDQKDKTLSLVRSLADRFNNDRNSPISAQAAKRGPTAWLKLESRHNSKRPFSVVVSVDSNLPVASLAAQIPGVAQKRHMLNAAINSRPGVEQ